MHAIGGLWLLMTKVAIRVENLYETLRYLSPEAFEQAYHQRQGNVP